MKLLDLKDGMIVETKIGKKYLILNGRMMNETTNSFLTLSEYNEDMYYNYNLNKDEKVHKHIWDIVTVYSTEGNTISELFNSNKLHVLWKREIEINWYKVPVDTPVYVRNYDNMNWIPRHFKEYKRGEFTTWEKGNTSFTSSSKDDCFIWKYCKLARTEDIEKYKL